MAEEMSLTSLAVLRCPALMARRPANNHGDAVALLVGDPALDPHAMRAHHIAVIGGESNDGVVGLPGSVERIEDAADLCVQLLGQCVVVRAAGR